METLCFSEFVNKIKGTFQVPVNNKELIHLLLGWIDIWAEKTKDYNWDLGSISILKQKEIEKAVSEWIKAGNGRFSEWIKTGNGRFSDQEVNAWIKNHRNVKKEIRLFCHQDDILSIAEKYCDDIFVSLLKPSDALDVCERMVALVKADKKTAPAVKAELDNLDNELAHGDILRPLAWLLIYSINQDNRKNSAPQKTADDTTIGTVPEMVSVTPELSGKADVPTAHEDALAEKSDNTKNDRKMPLPFLQPSLSSEPVMAPTENLTQTVNQTGESNTYIKHIETINITVQSGDQLKVVSLPELLPSTHYNLVVSKAVNLETCSPFLMDSDENLLNENTDRSIMDTIYSPKEQSVPDELLAQIKTLPCLFIKADTILIPAPLPSPLEEIIPPGKWAIGFGYIDKLDISKHIHGSRYWNDKEHPVSVSAYIHPRIEQIIQGEELLNVPFINTDPMILFTQLNLPYCEALLDAHWWIVKKDLITTLKELGLLQNSDTSSVD